MLRVRIMLGFSVLVGVASGSLAKAASAADWSQWQGPNRDAVSTETGLLKEWPADGPKLLWEMKGLGVGFSTVSIVGNRLYTMGDLTQDGGKSQFIIAFDLDTKEPVWTAKVGPPHGDGSRCTPTVDDGMVYAIGTEGDLVAVEAASGKEVWRKSFGKDFGGRMMSGWKYSESPLIDGEKLVCTPGSDQAALAALSKKTGEVIWKCELPRRGMMGGAGYSSAVISNGAGVKQYVQLMGRGAIGVRAEDGKFLWAYHRIANGTANISTPVATGDYVFVSTAYGTGSALLKLSKTDDAVKAEEVYFLDKDTFQNHHGGFVLIGDTIYGGHGHNAGAPVCVELKTGKVMWKAPAEGGGSAAVLAADGMLYFRYQDNTMALIEANPEKYVLKSKFKIPGRPGMGGPGWAHPVVLDGKLYLRHSNYLFCYDVKAQ